MFFAAIGEGQASMTIRNVTRVDGRRVPDSHDRVMRVLSSSRTDRTESLRALAVEGARFNIGNVRRTFNDPTLALMFFAPAMQSRFQFVTDGSERIDGVLTYRIRFSETARPSVIRDDRDDLDTAVSGVAHLTEDGRIVRTESDRGDRNAHVRTHSSQVPAGRQRRDARARVDGRGLQERRWSGTGRQPHLVHRDLLRLPAVPDVCQDPSQMKHVLALCLAIVTGATSATVQSPAGLPVPDEFKEVEPFVRFLEQHGLTVSEVDNPDLPVIAGAKASAYVGTERGQFDIMILRGPNDAERIRVTYSRGGRGGCGTSTRSPTRTGACPRVARRSIIRSTSRCTGTGSS